MAQRLPTRCNPDDRLNQRVLAGTMIKAGEILEGAGQGGRDLGAAARLDSGQVLHRPEPGAVAGGDQPAGAGRGFLDLVVEQDQAEAVPVGQGVEQSGRSRGTVRAASSRSPRIALKSSRTSGAISNSL